MRYILIGDNHWGKKKFNIKFFDLQYKLYEEQIIPYMKKNNLDTIIHLGDLFDNRIIMDIGFFDLFVNKFITLLKDNNIKFISILGNHDIYYKNRLDVNMVKYLNFIYDKFIVIDKITNIDNMTLIPWIISDNELPDDYNDIVLGHFEFQNIDKMITGKYSYNHFDKAKIVISGHYHNFSKKDNVIYIGTPYQLSWNDFNEIKGFYELNTDTQELKFIKNEITPIHLKLIYNNKYKKLLLKGFNESIFIDVKDLENYKKHKFKFIVETPGYEEIVYEVSKIIDFEFINEAKILELTGIDSNDNIEYRVETPKELLEKIPDKYKDIVQEIQNYNI